MGGLELIQTLRMRSHTTTRLIAYSTALVSLAEAARVGAHAAVLKQTDPNELLAALVAHTRDARAASSGSIETGYFFDV
jgi:DNA-binding response OmpR family regulator